MPIILLLVLLACFSIVRIVIFCRYVSSNETKCETNLPLELINLVLIPLFAVISFDRGTNKDCCTSTTIFAPEHSTAIYLWIVVSVITFFYSTQRTRIAPPLAELVINTILIGGLVLSLLIGYHFRLEDLGHLYVNLLVYFLGAFPVTLLFYRALLQNHRRLLTQIDKSERNNSPMVNFAYRILYLPLWAKFPLFALLFLPLLLLASCLLMIFGQQPDAVIRAFTETYRHGFSNYNCVNVHCGGHYLCSVAANGHPNIVQPQRIGFRGGHPIICNRQLLLSNAFEEKIQEQFPQLHSHIRKQYNKVGDVVHQYYYLFEKKWVSDLVYFAMKPAEWMFWLYLYTTDYHPENRIAVQYLKVEDRKSLNNEVNFNI